MNFIRHAAAYSILTIVYGTTWLVAALCRIIPRRAWKPTGRIMAIGTFHNPNWYLSHVTPLVRGAVEEVILVLDEPQKPIEGVRFVRPPRWISRLLSRAIAKAIWMIVAGLHYRPDLYMGYHMGPGPCSALIAARLLGRPSCYQMTGGPVVIKGGGIDAIGSVGGFLVRPSKLVEALAIKVIRQFELVVVRGKKAKEFLLAHGVDGSVAVITGSVNNGTRLSPNHRHIHLIFVGRLSPIKQVHQFITIVDAVRRTIPDIKAVIVGDGVLMNNLRASVDELALTDHVEFLGKREDVGTILTRSKVFALTSRSEGLSIAMAEAMVAGAVPVVADVGELGDLVVDGVNGHLVEPNDIDKYARRIVSLLEDQDLWERQSRRAVQDAKAHCGIEVVSEKWRQCIQGVVSQASGLGA